MYDSKKSGSYTISHLRFGPKRVRAPYLVKSASFVGVHKFDFLYKQDVLGAAASGATVLINSPYRPDKIWDELPRRSQQQIIDRKLKVFVVDASKVDGRVAELLGYPGDLLARVSSVARGEDDCLAGAGGQRPS